MSYWDKDESTRLGVSSDKDSNLKYSRLTSTGDSHLSEFYDVRTGMTFGHCDNVSDSEKKDFGTFVKDSQDNYGRYSK